MRCSPLVVILILACNDLSPGADAADIATPDGGGEVASEPEPTGTVVDPSRSDADQAELDRLRVALDLCSDQTAETFAARHALPHSTTLPYDPATAGGLELIQASGLALSDGELALLKDTGLVISERTRFPTFTYGYLSIYAMDLPLYVSADSILYAVHRSYDRILRWLEEGVLVPELAALLDGMRARLAATPGADPDLDVYLAVAASLLNGLPADAVAGGSRARIDALVAGALAAQGMSEEVLFGNTRHVDFSQFAPRGHYKDSPILERYFRAMMWLGRIDLRLIATRSDGSRVLQRREVVAAVQLRELMDDAQLARARGIVDAIAAFVGVPDSMTPFDVDALLDALGVDSSAAIAGLSDAAIAQAIVAGGFGQQRIASQIMFASPGAGELPLAASFALLGQAYVIDAHVLTNVTYSRVADGAVKRMMPSPLDVAYAVFDNDQAASLLAPELERHPYAPELCQMRTLVGAHDDAFWAASLYTRWLDALRTLSPSATEVADPARAGLPAIAATEAWGRRLLNTQLASWAELRHDTLLYAKPSYTDGVACEFPDAYVEPYPAFFAAIEAYAERGAALADVLDLSRSPWLASAIPAHFEELRQTAARLGEMAAYQRAGSPFTEEQLAFINDAVTLQEGCGAPVGANGWYGRLFFDAPKAVEQDPTIADVHTQPTDEVGTLVGRVLHVGTGLPRLMVVTADTCHGPRAYAGVVSSYFERVTEGFDRLDDQRWAAEVVPASPADVWWMRDLVARP